MIYTDEIINNPVKLSHYLIENRVENNIRACDMTAGNGNDSKFILDKKNPKILYAFDIQKLSQERCKKLIGQRKNFKFILDDHKNIGKYIEEKIDLFIYNLGFLPKGDKSITTNYKSVIQSLKSCLDLLNENGLILITFYPGHEEGKNEEKYVGEFLKNLDQKTFQVIKYNFYNQINNPPFLISIRKVWKKFLFVIIN